MESINSIDEELNSNQVVQGEIEQWKFFIGPTSILTWNLDF